jgi:hypothetical protein
MPSFDVVSEVDMQEVRNAVDQASRELANRYDFKGTNSTIELGDDEIKMATASEDRLIALRTLLEEKLVKRQVSLKAIDYGKVEEASGHRSARPPRSWRASRRTRPASSTSSSRASASRACSRQTQGRPAPGDRQEARRPPGVIAALKEGDFGIPLQFRTSGTDVPASTRARTRPRPARVGGRGVVFGPAGGGNPATRGWGDQARHSPLRRRRMRSSMGGWVAPKRMASEAFWPASGLAM